MYSTISKDKIDKHVIDFIYRLFVLLIISIEALHPKEHNLIGCWVKYLSLAVAQNNSEKERCRYGTAHAKIHTHACNHTRARASTHARTHIQHTQTCSRSRPCHSPNQFCSQASCQAAMLSKYYHNACVSVNMQLMNGWHPVKLRDTETEKLSMYCYCAWTPPHLPQHFWFLSLGLCDFLSLALYFRS